MVEYAKHLLPYKENRIVFTGYQDEGAPSRALIGLIGSGGGPRVVEVPDESGELIRIEAAAPAKVIQLSAHADQTGLLEYAARLQPNHIALVHGEEAAQEALRAKLLEAHPTAEVVCGPSELTLP